MKDIKVIVYSVKDIKESTKFFSKFLDQKPYVESSYYVGFKTGDHEVGLDPNSSIQTPIAYIDVEEIKSYLQSLVAQGGEIVEDPKDVGGGLLIAKIKDLDGNILGLRQHAT